MNTPPQPSDIARPHDYDHRHADVSSGWLRATVFGAMDGLVSNIGLIAGIAAAGASTTIVAITGISGLIAGAISMALGEYTSVRTANEQLDAEVRTERDAHSRNPVGEQAELAALFARLGMHEETADVAASQVARATARARCASHLAHELGLSLDDRPLTVGRSLLLAALVRRRRVHPDHSVRASASATSGSGSHSAAQACSSRADSRRRRPSATGSRGQARQLLFGGVAVAATYTIGKLLGVSGI